MTDTFLADAVAAIARRLGPDSRAAPLLDRLRPPKGRAQRSGR